jgi:phospho-N-acetylmuramoyl-pentapeptide-transferase
MARDALHYRYAKILAITVVGGIIGWWFYQKLGITTIHIPFSGEWYVGMYFIPFFVLVLIATYSTSVIDGLDGLAGGVLAIVFAAYSLIAFTRQEIDVATLCGVVAGAILAFLWFNIPPARFYMGETGIIGLMMLLTVIAFLTNTVFLLPIIALPLAATTLSNILQITAYKYFGKRRIFKIAPLHHHFQAMGWSKEKIVMRYWVVAIVAAIIGVVLSLIS